MSLILNIDTATEMAHVSIAKDGAVLKAYHNDLQKDHASFLQPAIQRLAGETGLALTDVDAIAVTGGPGSYTGLRVGLASAKGLCYALNKPLIMLSTLEVLTASAFLSDQSSDKPALFCPMIDARRMEVFTAIYDDQLTTQLSPQPMILDETSFSESLKKSTVVFFGNGSDKWKTLCTHPNALFKSVLILPEAMAQLSNIFLERNQFADIAYSEPMYLKDFQTLATR